MSTPNLVANYGKSGTMQPVYLLLARNVHVAGSEVLSVSYLYTKMAVMHGDVTEIDNLYLQRS